ncbi:MAG TPA: O-antigen ligase family protein [Saprospiraceae bacterium]|nr:O-antigen ligase family protein [Saprospiraceae bacterium]HPN69425.1 O-antigen ligase family protein [Saprospiraceae bacterium]
MQWKHIHRITHFFIYALLICTPLAVEVSFGSLKINMPTEPLLIITAVLLFFAIDIKTLWQSSFIRHPLTLLAISYQFWMTFMVVFSSDWLISLKYVLVNNVHFWVFYFGFYHFTQNQKLPLLRWVGSYGLALIVVIFLAWFKFMQFDFNINVAVILAQPFYNDNTIFSASLVFVLSVTFLIPNKNATFKFLKVVVLLLVGSAIFITYCRAAWSSIFLVSLVIFLIIIFNLKIKHFLALAFFLVLTIGLFLPTISNNLTSIKTESKKGNWLDQLASIGNITTDVSNLERINRYKCAIRMFKDRPITGFGPGTYQYAYLPYQKTSEMTRISMQKDATTTLDKPQNGRGGGAHSEYLQALSELGIFGFLCWLALLFLIFYTALKVYFDETTTKPNKKLTMTILFATLAYLVHATFNNFMHSEEVAILFWPMIAMLVLIRVGSEPRAMSHESRATSHEP